MKSHSKSSALEVEHGHDLTHKVRGAVEEFPRMIRRHPLESIAVGFGVGVLVAGLLRRSM